jgi:hypothetical protein
MRLVKKGTTEEVKIGDFVKMKNGNVVKIEYFRPPTSPASEGKINVSGHGSEYYVSVVGLEWIEREDRA